MSYMFFVIDGVDGTGKATQTALLVERLKREGHAVEVISFPQYKTPSAALLEKYLGGGYGTTVDAYQASVFFAVDRYDAAPRIRQALERGAIVVADRYVASNMGHQGGKIADPIARTAYFAWNDDFEYRLMGIPRPTLTMVLDMPAALSQKLAKENAERKAKVANDLHENSLEHLENARRVYQEIASSFPNFTSISCVNAAQELLSREAVHALLWAQVEGMLAHTGKNILSLTPSKVPDAVI
jgi:dTMP kinase